MMKIWVDDVRPVPNADDIDYVWCRSVEKTIGFIKWCEVMYDMVLDDYNEDAASDYKIELIDLDHDAGDYRTQGGDYIKILDWLEETNRNYPIRIHSKNPVGVENMRRIIKRNGWKEIR